MDIDELNICLLETYADTGMLVLRSAHDAIEQLRKEHLRTKGSLAIATNALSHTESQLAEWRSKAGELENENRRLRAELEEALKDAERYRKAVLDLARRGHGVMRPKWLIATIQRALDAVRQKG
jgi:chromosome segregation ATPase